MKEYLKVYLCDIGERDIVEDENIVLEEFKRFNLEEDNENWLIYLEKCKTLIFEIESIERDKWEDCITKDIIKHSVQNLNQVYESEKGLSDLCINYLNKFEEFDEIEKISEELQEKILLNDNIKVELYELIARSFKLSSYELGEDLKELSEEKTRTLVEEKILPVSEANYEKVNAIEDNGLEIKYILDNIDDCLGMKEQNSNLYNKLFEKSNSLQIIKSNEINDEIKMQLFKETIDEVRVSDVFELDDDIKEYYLDNKKFKEEDILGLFDCSNKFKDFEKKVLRILLENYSILANKKMKIEFDVFMKLLEASTFSEDDEITFICDFIEDYSNDEIKKMFESRKKLIEFHTVFSDNKIPKFSISSPKGKLVEILIKQKLVKKYGDIKNGLVRIKQSKKI